MDAQTIGTYADRNCPRFKAFLEQSTPDASRDLTDSILDTPNPTMSVARIEDLLAADNADTIPAILADRCLRSLFLTTIGGSRFLSSVLTRNPALLDSFFLRGGYGVNKSREDKERDLALRLDGVTEIARFDKILRVYKEEEYLRIGCRDLSGLADVVEIMRELSDLAAACIQAAVSFHQERLTLKHGVPPGATADTGFVVLGLGKLSGGELNFSSDVDLIYLRGPEEGRTDGPNNISVPRFYDALARAVSKSVSDPTEDGFVFRVDLRLRPEGEKGELVPSMSNALDYYLGWGRTWERAALMKAIPLAGDMELGREFLGELQPFIYRKYLDFSTLEDMRLMKLGIEALLKRKPGVNIKLGQGGIREIEFFVQALQLINAGKVRRIRTPSTLRALDLLLETDLLDSDTHRSLKQAYLFFRKTEHCIQINHQLQTHELPRTQEEQEELARRMGYRNGTLTRFLADLDGHRKVVEELFSGLFYHSGEDFLESVSPATRAIIQAIPSEESTVEVLAQYGLGDLADAYPVLKGLILPSEDKLPSEKGRSLLQRLAPLFVEELLKVPEPRQALVALDSFIDSLSAHAAYLSTLLENPPTVGFLMSILGESRFFTELLVHHPQAIDSLIARSGQDFPRSKAALENDVAERLKFCEDFEAELDVLRRFKNEQILTIGVHHLAEEIDSWVARRLTSELAEACLAAAVDLAQQEMIRKFGGEIFEGGVPFVILGMGKLGGREMTYLSDVDVIFIYDCEEQQIGRFASHEWFTRLANRIISILSVPTAEGTVFAIDTRLRPSGQKGPLVSSLAAFREYHSTTSILWEKQALTRARPITGPPGLASEVAGIVRDCLLRTRIGTEDLQEINRLRKRMENELALEDELHVDLKTGHGGLVDVEFFVQAHILKYASDHPNILVPNTLEALAELHGEGLIDEASFRTLDHGYRFLSSLEDRLRTMEYRSVNRMPLKGEKLTGLARRLGYGDRGEERFLEDYFRVTGSVREIYNRFFAGRSE